MLNQLKLVNICLADPALAFGGRLNLIAGNNG